MTQRAVRAVASQMPAAMRISHWRQVISKIRIVRSLSSNWRDAIIVSILIFFVIWTSRLSSSELFPVHRRGSFDEYKRWAIGLKKEVE